MNPYTVNQYVPINVDLICGDPLLELQSNAINTLANTQIPGTDTWISVIDWINDLINGIKDKKYDTIFMDCNPSFSIYTQIAISATDRIILPIMADDSSRRAIQNALSLVYGLHLPSPIYATYAFGTKLEKAKRVLPKVHLLLKNRITQYMGPASAYAAVLRTIETDVSSLLSSHSPFFSFTKISDGVVEVRDFQTTGVVSFARGCPFFQLTAGRLNIGNRRIQINQSNLLNCRESIDEIVSKL